jgi:tetratricopeptide (TPR) repeat protein
VTLPRLVSEAGPARPWCRGSVPGSGSIRIHATAVLVASVLVMGATPAEAAGLNSPSSVAPEVRTTGHSTQGLHPRPPLVPADTLTWEAEAQAAWVEGDQDRAEALYLRILEEAPETRIALVRLGLLRSWQDRLDRSVEYFDQALALDPGDLEAAAFRARVLAWQGELEAALAALGQILEAEPSNALALEIQAQVLSWAGEHEASAAAWDQLLAITPGDRGEIRRSRARALLSAGRQAEARRDLDILLEEDPQDHETRLALARILTLAGELGEAEGHLRRVLDAVPGRADAWAGLARVLTWQDRLEEGEEGWRRALELSPEDGSVRAGLVQNLRWQGRNHAALEAGRVPGREADPTGAELQEQLRWARAAVGPRTALSLFHERDSDGHRAWGGILTGALPLAPGLEVGWQGESRWMTLGELDSRADALSLYLARHLDPGWRLEVGAGGSSGLSAGGKRPSFRGEVSSPGRAPVGVHVLGRYAALDGTAALVERDVRILEGDLDLRWNPAPLWRMSGRGGLAQVDGRVRNRRWRGRATMVRGRFLGWSLGVVGQGMGFQENPGDGYFSPDRLLLLEAPARWRGQRGRWMATVEGAPGLQRIGEGDWEGAVRGTLGGGVQWAPGRELSLSLAGSSSGVDRVSVGDSDYRYTAATLGLRWSF